MISCMFARVLELKRAYQDIKSAPKILTLNSCVMKEGVALN